ncbi:MAG: DUF5320 domain-containing protein [Sedimentisphaerales bacterium]|nr:DUF5320 domain-containing protein [Sedimentisphaerales bacterium]
MGPMTGRAAGYCAGFAHPAGGRGFWGCGRGRGFRHWFHATGQPGWMRSGILAGPAAPEQELETLRQQTANLQSELNRINERVEQLQAQSDT